MAVSLSIEANQFTKAVSDMPLSTRLNPFSHRLGVGLALAHRMHPPLIKVLRF